MTVTRDPRPLRPVEPIERPETPEALIPEARQRARRRRGFYAFAVLLAVFLGVLITFSPTLGQRPLTALDELPAHPAPEVQEPAGILAKHGIVHFGWVIVYDDGRVIQSLDAEINQLMERHLTPEGIKQVRSGALHPGALILQPDNTLPAGIWADSGLEPYQPSLYAACYEPPASFEARAGYLPPGVQALLSGRDHTYKDVVIFIQSPNVPPLYEECANLTISEANYVGAAIVGDTKPAFDGIDHGREWCATVGPPLDAWLLCLRPVLPHGSWALWGG